MKTTDFDMQDKILSGIVQNEDSQAVAFSRLSPDHFSVQNRKNLFIKLRCMYDENKPINIITANEIRCDYPLDSLTDFMVVRPWEMEQLCDFIEEHRKLRVLRDQLENSVMKVDRLDPSQEIIDGIMDTAYKLDMTGEKQEVIFSGKEMAQRALTSIAERGEKDKRNKKVIYTQFKKLNYATGGFEGGDLIIVSSKTGDGKSAFCQNLADHISIRQTIPMLYINSEMSEDNLDFRFGAMLSDNPGVTLSRIRMGLLDTGASGEPVEGLGEYRSVAEGIDKLYSSQFFSVTVPDLRIEKVVNIVRKFHRKQHIRCVVVDYIGRMNFEGKGNDKEWLNLLMAARRIKTLAQQLNIVVIMVAQLGDDGSLRMSKQMDTEADLHLSVERLSESEILAQQSMMNTWNCKLHILKGRSAPKGFIMMHFNGEKLKFTMEE